MKKNMKQRLVCLFIAGAVFAGFTGCAGLDKDGGANSPRMWDDKAPADYDGGMYMPQEDGADGGEYILNQDAEDWRNVPFTENESYNYTQESAFKDVATSPLSTFSSSVDTASYSNMRRQIESGIAPRGVRIEELVNYFSYDYEKPAANAEHPFSLNAEIAPCPWNGDNLLAMVGIQGEDLHIRPASNIVFLIDVSGSMSSANRLPLLKESFLLLIEQLDENDVISIVTYAGSNKIVADSVRGSDHKKLSKIIKDLSTGGSTGGADGIRSAYKLAEKNFIEDGNNRVILATDGDFNVGESSVDQLITLIEEKSESGVFISVLGYGMGNLKDDMMEAIAKHGNGNYAYIDNISEAKKVLVNEFDSTMYVIAKDLKIQVEFNPAAVQSYRLIGYDNRRLENEDFNNDAKDAGDVGAGHCVTAFYELVLSGGDSGGDVDPLRYQQAQVSESDDYMTVKVRYKAPNGGDSKLTELPVTNGFYSKNPSNNFLFASAVAEFGLILTESEYRASASVGNVLAGAKDSIGGDEFGLRKEFISLVQQYQKFSD